MYSARITRDTPTAFIFMIDRSGSMAEKMLLGDLLTTKAESVAIVTNRLIRELINRCRREEGVMDYFDIAVIGYGHNGARMLLGEDDKFVSPSRLALSECPRRTFTHERELPDGRSTVVTEEIRYWVTPHAEGATPMLAALSKAYEITAKWCGKKANRNSYPPTIFNITDGEASDGDNEQLIEVARRIRGLGTNDGQVLLININLSSGVSDQTVIFPASRDELPVSKYTYTLFEMSSIMPQEYDNAITRIRGGRPPYRGMSYNTSIADLITLMDIGSRSINRMQ